MHEETEADPAVPVLDLKSLEKVRYFTDPAVKAIADAYFARLTAMAEDLEDLRRTGDWERLSSEARRNLGSCLCLGLARLAEVLGACAADPRSFDAAAFRADAQRTAEAIARLRADRNGFDPR